MQHAQQNNVYETKTTQTPHNKANQQNTQQHTYVKQTRNTHTTNTKQQHTTTTNNNK
jgi:hypothetical protein